MQIKVTTAYHLGDRPTVTPSGDTIPADWLIFRATRPLDGSVRIYPDGKMSKYAIAYEDDQFIHGCHVGCVNPKQGESWLQKPSRIVKDNVSADGWLIIYVTKQDILDWGTAYLKAHDLDIKDFDWDQVLDSYANSHFEIDTEIEVEA